MKLSVIIPALNEEKNILSAIDNVLASLKEFALDGEIIVVNDGSSDSTASLVREEIKKQPDIIGLVEHDAPRGIGASFWDGVNAARGTAVVMIPGDNENDPREIFRYCGLLESADIVIPFIVNKKVRSLTRRIISFIYLFAVNTVFFTNFNYTNGTILYRKNALNALDRRSNGFFFQTDILVRLVKRGYLFAEVPCRLGARAEGSSKAITFLSAARVMRDYLRLAKDYYFGKKWKE